MPIPHGSTYDWIQCDNPAQIRFETVVNRITQYLFFKDNDFWQSGYRVMKRSERDFLVIPNAEIQIATEPYKADIERAISIYPDCDPAGTDHDWIDWSIK